MAFTTGNNLLYLVLGSMIGFLILSGLLSEASLRGLELERALPDELYAKTPARVVLRLTQRKARVPAFAVTLTDEISGTRGFRPAGGAQIARLRSGESVSRAYTFVPARRGELTFERVQVSTRFPFGLFVKRFTFVCSERTLVFPALDVIDRVGEGASSLSEQGVNGPGVALADMVGGLRDFQQGDSFRRVHWKHSLRSGQLLVADRDRGEVMEAEVVLEMPARAAGALVEARVTRAASQVDAYNRYGWNVSFRAEGVAVPSGSGRRHRNKILSYLACYPAAPGSHHPGGARLGPAS